MKAQLLNPQPGARSFFLVFAPGDTFLLPMVEFVRRENILGGSFSAVGALSGATLAWFDTEAIVYRPIEVQEQVEVASMVGNISWMNGKPFIHAHCVLGRRTGGTIGGHVKDLTIMPALEMSLTESLVRLDRRKDPQTGFALIDLHAK
jgi:predicted DNA-binding protein with PD1-like motif